MVGTPHLQVLEIGWLLEKDIFFVRLIWLLSRRPSVWTKVEVQWVVGSSIEFHHLLPLQFFLWTEFIVMPNIVFVMPLFIVCWVSLC